MSRYAAFLRAINLGRNRRVGSADLRAAFEEAGFDEVVTFRTSGNVAFSATREARTKMTGRIERALRDALGYEVPIYLRTDAEVRAIAEHEPFSAKRSGRSKGKLQVLLLPRPAAAGTRKKALALATDDDLLAFGKRELYWLPRGGTQESGLDLKALEKLLGPATIRTRGTIEQMAGKFFDG
jgi:uncharacterized protein (DUF1697 family)